MYMLRNTSLYIEVHVRGNTGYIYIYIYIYYELHCMLLVVCICVRLNTRTQMFIDIGVFVCMTECTHLTPIHIGMYLRMVAYMHTYANTCMFT